MRDPNRTWIDTVGGIIIMVAIAVLVVWAAKFR